MIALSLKRSLRKLLFEKSNGSFPGKLGCISFVIFGAVFLEEPVVRARVDVHLGVIAFYIPDYVGCYELVIFGEVE